MNLLRVIDYETTGTPQDPVSEVIELAYVDVDPVGCKILDCWHSLAKPLGAIPPEVKAVHHIMEEDVATAAPVAQLWDRLYLGCGPRDALVAHNAAFEQHYHAGDGRPWIDTFKCALIVWPEAPAHSNQVLRYWLDLDRSADFDRDRAMPPHRALPDAYVTAHIVIRLLGQRSIEDLIRISSEPALLRRVGFGKHRGQPFADVPSDYLQWIIDKAEFGEDVTATAKFWLKCRSEQEFSIGS